MSPGVTMKVIAARAGVTQATVSMCLAGSPRVSAATRDRVRSIAGELGYQPNPYVSMLMRLRRFGKQPRQRPVLAFVCLQAASDGWRNHSSPSLRQIHEGAFEHATIRGYAPQEFWIRRDGMSDERFSAMLTARGIHGVVLGPRGKDEAVPSLHWDEFSVVNLGASSPSLTVTTVGSDHYAASVSLLRECFRRGYRRPGIVLDPDAHTQSEGRWLAGFFAGCQMTPSLSPVRPLLVDDLCSDASLAAWLLGESPDVVITPSADAVAAVIRRNRLRCPEDVGIAVLSCHTAGAEGSGIYQNGRHIGALAVDALILKLERHERGLSAQATTILVEGAWNEGRTLRPPDRQCGS